jgi:hypothetical protein
LAATYPTLTGWMIWCSPVAIVARTAIAVISQPDSLQDID